MFITWSLYSYGHGSLRYYSGGWEKMFVINLKVTQFLGLETQTTMFVEFVFVDCCISKHVLYVSIGIDLIVVCLT